MLAAFLEYDSALDFEADAQDYELGLKCAHGIRSLAAEYGILTAGHALIRSSTEFSYTKTSAQLQAIKALCDKGIEELAVLGPVADEDSMSRGYAVFVIWSDICRVA